VFLLAIGSAAGWLNEKGPRFLEPGASSWRLCRLFLSAYVAPGLSRERRRRLRRRTALWLAWPGEPQAFWRHETGVRFLLELIGKEAKLGLPPSQAWSSLPGGETPANAPS